MRKVVVGVVVGVVALVAVVIGFVQAIMAGLLGAGWCDLFPWMPGC